MADAAREAGAEIRTGVEVREIRVKDGEASGVVIGDGSEIAARTIVSGADTRRTFRGLIDPVEREPGFITRIRNYRVPGTVAKVNFALSALPAFTGLSGNATANLQGRVHIGPGIDYLERAFDASKYGELSAAPYLDITFPSIHDPGMAPAGRHVMSVHVQYAPYKLRSGSWTGREDLLAGSVTKTLEAHAPGFTALIEHRQVITPMALEQEFALTGGHIHHGELALDQLFTMRPTLGWANYRTPIDGLFLCGSGTHPGHGITGASGRNAAREVLKAAPRAARA
jgi:phytoene dehydrogenase-like protein